MANKRVERALQKWRVQKCPFIKDKVLLKVYISFILFNVYALWEVEASGPMIFGAGIIFNLKKIVKLYF